MTLTTSDTTWWTVDTGFIGVDAVSQGGPTTITLDITVLVGFPDNVVYNDGGAAVLSDPGGVPAVTQNHAIVV